MCNCRASQCFILPVQPFTIAIVFFKVTVVAVDFGELFDVFLPVVRSGSVVNATFIIQHRKFISRKYIQLLGYFLETYITVKCNSRFSVFTTALGSNNDYTISTTGTVDSCSRSIFQDVDCFNFRRVKGRHTVFAGETVDDIQRFVTLSNGNTTTNPNRNGSSGSTFTLHNLHTCHAAGKGLCDITGRNFRKFFAINRSNRTGQVLTFYSCITDGYNFVQQYGICLQRYINNTLIVDFHFLGSHSHIRKN